MYWRLNTVSTAASLPTCWLLHFHSCSIWLIYLKNEFILRDKFWNFFMNILVTHSKACEKYSHPLMDYLFHYTGFISGNREQSHISLLPDGKCRLPICWAMLLHRICLPICLKAMSLVFSNNYLITIPVEILQYHLIFDFFGHLGLMKQARKTQLWHIVSTYSCNCEWICKFSAQQQRQSNIYCQLCVWPWMYVQFSLFTTFVLSVYQALQLLNASLFFTSWLLSLSIYTLTLAGKQTDAHCNERSKINTIQ